jgi:hypothetical protein
MEHRKRRVAREPSPASRPDPLTYLLFKPGTLARTEAPNVVRVTPHNVIGNDGYRG